MRIEIGLRQVAITLGTCGAIAGVGVWIANAQESHKQTRSNTEQIRILTEIKVKEKSREEAEHDLTRRYCLQGKLDRKSPECLEALR